MRALFDGPVVLAGGLGDGTSLHAAIALGCDLGYMGTRFIATEEAHASAEYKQMIVDSKVEDIVYTPAVSGVPASFMRQSLEKAGYDMEKLRNPGEVDYGQKLKPVDEEAKAWKTVWSAGQGVGGIHDVPSVAALVELGVGQRPVAGVHGQLA